jgi:hypothetical protein
LKSERPSPEKNAERVVGRAFGVKDRRMRTAILADGRPAVVNAFRATVYWHGEPRTVPALEVEGSALVGMALLHGSRLTMDVLPNGPVRVEPLPQR